MARKSNSSSTAAAVAFLNITLRDERSGETFTLGGKALPSADLPRGQSLPCRVIRKLWQTAESLPSGEFPFPSHGTFENFLHAMGLSISLSVRRLDDEAVAEAESDDISF